MYYTDRTLVSDLTAGFILTSYYVSTSTTSLPGSYSFILFSSLLFSSPLLFHSIYLDSLVLYIQYIYIYTMASDEEKQLGLIHGQGTLQTLSSLSDKDLVQHVSMIDSRLALSEEEALAQSRAEPETMLPIYLTFAPDDRDNPRNWAKWRKWYISCFASMLNVVTYVLFYSQKFAVIG